MRSVAEKRLGDAKCLRDSGQNARANGVMYLAGLVIECLLKARLMEKHQWLQTALPDRLSESDRSLWSLCFRSHDLSEILTRLPEVYYQFDKNAGNESGQLKSILRSVCGQWTIFARYSPRSASMAEAGQFLQNVLEIKKWLMQPNKRRRCRL